MPDVLVGLTPAERDRFTFYALMNEFTHGYTDTILGVPNARRPEKTSIRETRAYNFGRECALMREKHHASHRGVNHSHECSFCHFSWWHSEKSLDCEVCHTCPNCDAPHQSGVVGWSSLEEEKKFLFSKLDNMLDHHLPTSGNILIVQAILLRLKKLGVKDVLDLISPPPPAS